MTQEMLEALGAVDRFHKNCQLLFDDLVAAMHDKTLTGRLVPLLGPEGGYVIGRATESEHQRQFVFDHDGRIRFAWMLVKTKEQYLRTQSAGFKAVCQQLQVDPVFPLLLVTGVFEPKNDTRFRNEVNLRRTWVGNTLLLYVPDGLQLGDPMAYGFDTLVTIMSPDGSNP